jgi:hypothetical protein
MEGYLGVGFGSVEGGGATLCGKSDSVPGREGGGVMSLLLVGPENRA